MIFVVIRPTVKQSSMSEVLRVFLKAEIRFADSLQGMQTTYSEIFLPCFLVFFLSLLYPLLQQLLVSYVSQLFTKLLFKYIHVLRTCGAI